MKPEDLTIALRPRSGWEAVELGSALARRHFVAILRPWLALSLPLWALLNAACWAMGVLWLAPLLMWWLKPAFDRIPLLVLSRAVFGQVPTTRQTLRALPSWSRPHLLAHLTWRRLSPVRSLYLPVDLLEGSDAAIARARRRVIGAGPYGVAMVLTLVFVHFEIALYAGANALALVFVPEEYLAPTAQWLMQAVEHDAPWVALISNLVLWLATSVLEPFYVGAGLGLYLNRRTELEGWDIEIAFRRLRTRLAAAPLVVAAALVFACALPVAPAQAQLRDASEVATPEEVFRDERADATSLRRAVEKTYRDPRVSPRRTITTWRPRERAEREASQAPPWLEMIGRLFGLVAEYGLWLLVGLLASALLFTARRWWPWLRDGIARDREEPPEPERVMAHSAQVPLPHDVIAAARRLWSKGYPREALALVYRAAVAAMCERADVTLVPGATEAECLRAARLMPEAEDRHAFADAVRTWQYAAYAQRMPDTPDFEALLSRLAERFGWRA